MTGENAAPAEMPGVEEIARALCVSEGKDPDFDYDPLGLGRPAGTDLRWRRYEKSARAILDLFAPILAEKEREIERLSKDIAVKARLLTTMAKDAEAALAAERERCAKIAEETGFRTISVDIAAAIRAQANNEPGA